jgi:hypothetical protein
MGNSFNRPGDYRIEISGWGLDNCFFVERTELLWDADGGKQVCLHRTLKEGNMVFVRLLPWEPNTTTVPVAYEVQSVTPMDRDGKCRVSLAQMRPRLQESRRPVYASKFAGDSKRARDVQEESVADTKHEEVLR